MTRYAEIPTLSASRQETEASVECVTDMAEDRDPSMKQVSTSMSEVAGSIKTVSDDTAEISPLGTQPAIFFFFQAEDGIRDYKVTGVQTCALPISHANRQDVPPNSFALARSVEYFRIPRNVLTICVGKSTYARCGIITNVTPFEPEWEGHVTLEISNTTPLPARIYANEGICQVLFFEADEDDICEISYADKAGKYQRQTGVTLPKL